MEKIKTILDREPLSSEYIRSKQDFAKVMNGAKGLSKPYWKTNWFYGVVGVATVAVIVTAVMLTNSEKPEDSEPKKVLTATTQSDSGDLHKKELGEKELLPENHTDEAEQSETVIEEVVPEEEPQVNQREQFEEEVENARVVQTSEEEKDVVLEIPSPNIAGVSSGPIAFSDFCDPLGIQVGKGVLIYRYTIQYRSCARDVTARVSGNKLPPQLCAEIKDCGAPIEVNFSKIEAYDRDNEKVELKDFSLVTSPR